ncbi:MAG: hypothetical protein ABI480_01115 [Chitinophagaceae bacterium]
MKRFIISCFLTGAFFVVFAQQKNNAPVKPTLHSSIKVKAKSYNDSIIIRWAPADAWAWVLLNSTGYTIERTDFSNPAQPKKEILGTVKAYTLEKLKTSFGRDDKYAAIAAQALYGKNFNTGIRQGNLAYADQAAVLKDRHAFALQAADYDARVAGALGLKWVDKNVSSQKFYSYRIYPAGKTQGIIDTGSVFIQNKNVVASVAPEINDAIGLDRVVELHWSRFQEEQYSGFIIEKSADGKNFIPINTIPYFSSLPDSSTIGKDTVVHEMVDMLRLNHILMDSVKANYTNYYYRIKGINAFAEWSGYSKPVMVMTRDMKPPSTASVGKPEYLNKRSIKIQWVKDVNEPDFKGFTVSRATNVQGPYELITKNILDKKINSFVDENAIEHEENFYIVSSIDTAGNQAPSYPVMGLIADNTPPATPTGLKGTIDKRGYVHLSWNANKEDDMKGYKVYFTNNENQTVSQVTLEPVADTVYTDTITLKTLTKNIYYRIVAVDMNNNHSDYSPVAKLRKPDVVPPMPPVAGNVDLTAKGVSIQWMQSGSEDAVGYIIFRSEKENEYKPVARVRHQSGLSSFLFTDTTVKALVSYKYTAEAIDEDSLHSARCNPIPVTIRTLPDQPAISGLAIAYDNKTKKVKLNWQYKQTGNYFFVIYRAAGNDPLGKYSSTGSDQSEWVEYLNAETGTIKYAVQAVFRDAHGNTRLSEPVSIMVNSSR